MPKQPSRAWLARATSQFARTVYSELRRAGHTKSEIVRFINQLMDLLSQDADRADDLEQPVLIDPEAGLPGPDTMHDIVEFELRIRRRDRRGDERLVVIAIDVILPSWTSSVVRQRTHDLVAQTITHELRVGDTFGQLGPDRYLVVLPRAKDAVRTSIQKRILQALERQGEVVAEPFRLELRFATIGSGTDDATSAVEVLQRCFVATPESLQIDLARAPVRARAPRMSQPPTRDLVLALGGGAARAASHAGVLQVLSASNIRVIGASGCSAGAIVGAMLARGMPPDQIVARFAEFTSTAIFREMRGAYARFLRETRNSRGSRMRYFGTSLAFYSDQVLSALSNDHLGAFLRHFLPDDCDIAALAMPFSVVATDLVEGRSVRLAHGSLHAALAASCAVPGLFPPQTTAGRVLVDGGTITEVPIWAAHMLGMAAPVLAIHMGRPFHRVADYQTSTEVSTRSNALIHAELVREQLRRADLLLTVPMDEIGWLDFRQAHRIVEIGRRTAEQELPRLLARLAGGVGSS
jgi:NTE family protein